MPIGLFEISTEFNYVGPGRGKRFMIPSFIRRIMNIKEKKVIIRLSGGLGNQLFQYAVGQALEEEHGVKIVYDEGNYRKDKNRKVKIKEFCNNYKNISRLQSLWWKVVEKFLNNRDFGMFKEEYPFEYYSISERYSYLIGCWQNLQYFGDIREYLTKEIHFFKVLNEKQKKYLEIIRSENSVAVHVRHGDYLQNQDLYVIPDAAYYKSAMDYFEREYVTCKFYVFSDDMEWCKKNLDKRGNCVFVDESISISDQVDFELMRNCKGFVIANSSFSWWASWLSEREDKKMIAPKEWFCIKHDQALVKEALLESYILM